MSNRDLFVRIKAKTVTVGKVFDKIVSFVEGFRVQTPTDGRRSDLLILEVGDDVEKELEVIASLATSNVAGESSLPRNSLTRACSSGRCSSGRGNSSPSFSRKRRSRQR